MHTSDGTHVLGGARPARLQGRFETLVPTLGLAILLAATVCLLAWSSLAFSREIGRVAPIWLPNAVWLVFLLKARPGRWPLLILAGLAGNILACKLAIDPWTAAIGTSLANSIEVAVCAFGVRRLLQGRIDAGRTRDLAWFGLIAAIAAVTAAVIGSAFLAVVKGAPFFQSLLVWFSSDVMGLLILTPPVMVVAQGELGRLLEPAVRGRALAVFSGLLAAIGVAALMPQHPVLLLTPPLLMLAALQLEMAGAALGMLIVSAAVIGFIGLGWTPLVLDNKTLVLRLVGSQGFLLVMGLMTFPIAAVLARRRELETALVASNAALVEANRLASLAEGLAGIGYWRTISGSGDFTWSDQMFSIYGVDPAAGTPDGASIIEFVHPDDREILLRHREVYGHSAAPKLEVRIVRPDGEIRHVMTHSIVEQDPAGEVIARFGTLNDITDIKRAEAAALESEQRYRFLADNAPDMITRTSITGDMLYVSPSSERVLGYSPEEMKRQNASEMVHPDDYDRVMQGIFQLVEERRVRLPEPLCYRARNKVGEWVWIEANPMLIFDEHGEPMEFVDIVRNVTQTKLFEAELDEARRRAEAAAAAKSAFLANMSHELRTPLTSIIGFSRLMGERGDLPQEARQHTRRIHDASEALLSIINDVLDFSKLDAGQMQLELQPLSVQQLVDETTGLIAIQAAARGLEIRTELDPSTPPQVTGDVSRLRQVLLNFLSNAVKFTAVGSVTVKTVYRARGSRPTLRVEIIDTGAGVAPENVERLFERFSQAEVSINRTHGGTGLGLAISKGIIELMGGKIGVKTRIGQGSTFWFEVPAAMAKPVAAQDQVAANAVDCPPMRLLVVDDTAVNRELVRLMLEPLGFDIQEAAGGSDGIQAAMTQAFDLILMDLRMPEIDGLEATRMIRATSPLNDNTPILALTADVQPENAAACRAAGMNDVLAKPIVPAVLLEKIMRWGVQPDPEEARATLAG